jgi:hypothetical protein
MNARRGICLFHVVVNQTQKYNNNQYYADNHLIIILGKHSKRQNYRTENKEQYLRTLSEGHRIWVGLLARVHCTVQIHPC